MSAGRKAAFVVNVKQLGGEIVHREEFPVTFVRRVQDDSIEVGRRAVDRAVELAKEAGWTPGSTQITPDGPMSYGESDLRGAFLSGRRIVRGEREIFLERHNLGYGSAPAVTD